QRLGMPEEEIAAVDEAVVEVRDDDALRRVIEIDDDVAAEDDVEVAEERDARLVVEIEAAEGDAVAHLVLDLPRAVRLPHEVLVAQRGLRRAERALAILPAPRLLQHLLIDVAG